MSFIFPAGLTTLKTAIRSSNMAAKPSPESNFIITRHPYDGCLDRMSDAVGDSAANHHRLDWERIARHAATESEFRTALSGLKQQIASKASGRKPSGEETSAVYSCKAS